MAKRKYNEIDRMSTNQPKKKVKQNKTKQMELQ